MSSTATAPLTPFEAVTLVDEASQARVVVAPARGGMVTRFWVGERPVLFLDEATLADPAKNVRGGNPVLFPAPGPLVGDRFERAGRAGAMKQHGFARQRSWAVVDAGPREVTLELGSDEATRTQFPWEFRARLRYALSGARLTVATTVVNPGVEELPFALGFHPYFHLPSSAKAGARIPTSATRAWDNVSKQAVDVRGPIDLTQPEVDLHLLDHGERRAVLDRGADRVVVEADAAFVRWVIWTLAGKDFVCLEPWTSPADALNSGDHLLTLAPGASRTLTMSIATELA